MVQNLFTGHVAGVLKLTFRSITTRYKYCELVSMRYVFNILTRAVAGSCDMPSQKGLPAAY